MSTRPDEIPFDEPAGQPPLEPSPFTEPGPSETPPIEPDPIEPQPLPECPPDSLEKPA
jgi:hypothetical protein